MYSLLIKEINGFFSSVTGYLVIIVFLLVNSLFLWVFPGDMNILEGGYANLDPLFLLAPWVFLFLVPAVSMRMFSEENRSGTLEFLMTKPLHNMQIVMAKYLAGLILVLFSLLPSLIYYYSVHSLGKPAGNLDSGGILGSFIGLFFLASVYTSIGIFASSLTGNQIIAFLVGIVLSFLVYTGFDYVASIGYFSPVEETIMKLGINEHYKSMSRGVLDSRDLVYFVCVNLIFLFFTRTRLQSWKL